VNSSVFIYYTNHYYFKSQKQEILDTATINQ